MQLNRFTRSLDGFEAVVAGVEPNRWNAPSPCPGWSARDVAGHAIGTLVSTRALVRGRDQYGDQPATQGAFAGDDPLGAWRAERTALMTALDPAALALTVPGPWGPMPLGELLEQFSMEFLVHAWDLAQATGQAVMPDPDLVREALEPARQFAPLARLGDLIGPEPVVAAGADDLTQLLAIFGRAVQAAGKGQ